MRIIYSTQGLDNQASYWMDILDLENAVTRPIASGGEMVLNFRGLYSVILSIGVW